MTISKKEVIGFDTEVFGNTFLFTAKSHKTKKVVQLWAHEPGHMLHMVKLLNNPDLLWVSFNGINFDAPIIAAAGQLRDERELKVMANAIIENRMPAWMVYRDYGVERLEFDHIDLIEVAPGVMVSLKQYEARLKLKRMQDLPYHHASDLNAEQRLVLAEYCVNDIDATLALWDSLQEAIELREHMSETYKMDLRSKSDAQMAETIIVNSLGLARSEKPKIPRSVRYKAPPFVQLRSSVLQYVLDKTAQHEFKINPANGAVELPDFLANEPLLIGTGVYQMGVGGLHSKHDKCVCYVESDDFVIEDWDCAAFYPNLILNAGFAPKGLGDAFLGLFKKIVDTRIAAKKRAKELSKKIASLKKQLVELCATSVSELEHEIAKLEKELAQAKAADGGGKIQINGTFGKLGSCFSRIYSPDLMLGVTLSGQFYLLGLIEQIIELGATIISANTDGIVIGAHPDVMKQVGPLIQIYGWLTNFEFEQTQYRLYAAKDVNNYVAVTRDGKIKSKGLYAISGLQKNPTNEVCVLAVQQYLANLTPVEETINKHLSVANFADFTQARAVKGGAVQYTEFAMVDDWFQVAEGQWARPGWDLSTKATVKRKSRPPAVRQGVEGEALGRVARWYYSVSPGLEINYVTSGNKVPKSDGGRACMVLPEGIPGDLDIAAYIAEAKEILGNIGVTA